MGKALMVARPGAVLASGDEFNLFGYSSDTTTESRAQVSCTEDAVFSKLGTNIISGGSGTNNFQFRDAGADGSQLATRAGTGLAEDATNSDTLSAGDLFNIAYTDTGTNSTCAWHKMNVEFASGHGNFHGSASYNFVIHDEPSSTRFIGYSGHLIADAEVTEANVSFKNRAYTSQEALQVSVAQNARVNDSIFRNRINSGNGTAVITFGAGVTGLIVDDALGDALADGDLINASITLDTGVQDLNVTFVVGTFKSTNEKSEIWCESSGGLSRSASSTANYLAIGGYIFNDFQASEADAQIKPGFAAVVSGLRCYLEANTYTGDGTLKLYQNGSAVMTTTITAAGGAAWYENTVNTITIDDDDVLSFEFDEGTTGSITINMVGITFAPVAVGGLSIPIAAYHYNHHLGSMAS